MAVSADALQPIQHRLPQRADILIQQPIIHDARQRRILPHIRFRLRERVGRLGHRFFYLSHLFPQLFLDLLGFPQQLHMYLFIKIYVRQCCKQSVFDETDHRLLHRLVCVQ